MPPKKSSVMFQSTPPVKAATFGCLRQQHESNVSIHAAREGGDGHGCIPASNYYWFQSTPPVKAATSKTMKHLSILPFQSTPPVKAATQGCRTRRCGARVSIHAAREGGDQSLFKTVGMIRVSIHAAREGGDIPATGNRQHQVRFQSTPPVKAATSSTHTRRDRKGGFNPRRP